MQLLRGLRIDYNSMVSSLTAREDDFSLYSVCSILLTHEQHLCFQNSRPEGDNISTNMSTRQGQNYNNKNHNNRGNNHFNNRNNFGRNQSTTHSKGYRGNNNTNQPWC